MCVMDKQEEITKKAEHIVRLLKKGNFFDDYPFILPLKLKIALEVAMFKKWNEVRMVDLSKAELFELVTQLNRDGLSDTLYECSQKGYLKMAVNKNGELVYTIADTGKSIELLNKRQKFLLESFYLNKKND